ncbi:MAG: response regulator transcription factor [Candidatus Saccharibacteria bacterium]
MKLLVVEDEPKLGRAIKRGLEQDGYAVDLQANAEDGLAFAETETYDVIILDRMLPGGADGLDICKALRKNGNTTPTLMLTARGEIEDRVTGLDSGADDYLVKPFDFDELLARVRALVRRPVEAVSLEVVAGPIRIDTALKRVSVRGKDIHLSKKEYALLEYLAHHPKQISSKDHLIEHVWNFEADVLPNTVEVFIRSIRTKIDDPKSDSLIETVRGFGYRLRVGE